MSSRKIENHLLRQIIHSEELARRKEHERMERELRPYRIAGAIIPAVFIIGFLLCMF